MKKILFVSQFILLSNLLMSQNLFVDLNGDDLNSGQFFHTNWTGRGGTTASTTYNE